MNDKAHQKFLPYGRQTIEDDDITAVVETLRSDFLTTGPKVQEFESLLAEKVGAKEAVVVGNGTQALHLACLQLGLGKGDWAIVTAITFLATANAVRYCGADVLFSDVDPDTGIMTPEIFEETILKNSDKNIKAVLPVHLGSNVADLQGIKNIADSHNIKILADSCHALGGSLNEKPIGSCYYEDMSTFSFHPVKNIAMGEGGAITTNDSTHAENMRYLRSHGMVLKADHKPWFYEMPELGFNYRATDIQCALGISQLKKLDRFIAKREELANLYTAKLNRLSDFVQAPQKLNQNIKSGWHLYALRIDFKGLDITRADFMKKLKFHNVGSQVHYIPVSSQPYYEGLYGKAHLEGASHYYESTLSIPLFPTMEHDDVEYVVDVIKKVISER